MEKLKYEDLIKGTDAQRQIILLDILEKVARHLSNILGLMFLMLVVSVIALIHFW